MSVGRNKRQLPDFSRSETLRAHLRDTLAFYLTHGFDPAGGFHDELTEDGATVDRRARHLVASARYVVGFSTGFAVLGDPSYRHAAVHALTFLRERHRRADGGYVWHFGADGEVDGHQHTYGLVFTLLAYARATIVGIKMARPWIDEISELLDRYFWSPEHGLYADQISSDWSVVAPYRGQNANMHACEALLAAYEATGQGRYLDRAVRVADNITRRQAALSDGLIWEHYRADWSIDWHFNRHVDGDRFRPWGYQPGHWAEWAKLLLLLHRHSPLPWLASRAKILLDLALRMGWDATHEGVVYTLTPEGDVHDAHKHWWVQVETIAGAALLAHHRVDAEYWNWYHRLWKYCWTHFVDHRYGGWRRVLARDQRVVSGNKSACAYHVVAACADILPTLPPIH